MRGMALVVLAGLALAGSAGAEQIYRWVDASGGVHFSNAPAEESHAADVGTEAVRMQTGAPEAPPAAPRGTAVQASRGAPPDASPGDRLRRYGRERDLRATQQRLQDIDAQLAALAKVRTAHAGGTPGTGGLGTNAAAYLSPEEEKLQTERDEVQQQLDELRGTASAAGPAGVAVKPAGSP
jgi:Domain of unknown function (DUF4124)